MWITILYPCSLGFPGGSLVKALPAMRSCRRHKFDPWVGKISWRRTWKPTPLFLPGESHGQRSLAGNSPWGHKEWLKWLNMHAHIPITYHTATMLQYKEGKICTFSFQQETAFFLVVAKNNSRQMRHCLMGIGILISKMKRVLQIHGSDGFTAMWM